MTKENKFPTNYNQVIICNKTIKKYYPYGGKNYIGERNNQEKFPKITYIFFACFDNIFEVNYHFLFKIIKKIRKL